MELPLQDSGAITAVTANVPDIERLLTYRAHPLN